MGFGTSFAVYFVIWWMMIFITLPFRMRTQMEEGEVADGTEAAAPANPQILKRMLWNTGISAVIFGVYWLTFFYFDFGLDDLPDFLALTSS
ncbi:MAG: hypothetical protein COC23_05850 [Hyphomicrobiales bacterium]|nr:MAG: hypothetical protein COC23_05850 [Hyphomicrobiales bacterium]